MRHDKPSRLHIVTTDPVGLCERVLVCAEGPRSVTGRGKLIPYVERIRAALGISQLLREPLAAKKMARGQVDEVCLPATRFPPWMRCLNPKCGALIDARGKILQQKMSLIATVHGVKKSPD